MEKRITHEIRRMNFQLAIASKGKLLELMIHSDWKRFRTIKAGSHIIATIATIAAKCDQRSYEIRSVRQS